VVNLDQFSSALRLEGKTVNRALWRCASAAAGVVLTLTSLAAPAAAADSTLAAGTITPAAMSACGSGNFCAWVNSNFNDGPGQWAGNASNYTDWGHDNCGLGSLWTWDNCASSVFNNGQHCNLTFYDGINYTGAYYNLPRGSYLANMTLDRMSDGQNANDRISSHRWCTF
jgi:hypothetical protein